MRPLAFAAALIVAAATVGAQPIATREWLIAGRLTQGGILFGTAPPGTVAVTVDGSPVRLTGDRRFLAGFGRDAPATATLVARLADGTTDRRVVSVEPRHYDIESIPSLKQRAPDAPPDPVYDARRAVELARDRRRPRRRERRDRLAAGVRTGRRTGGSAASTARSASSAACRWRRTSASMSPRRPGSPVTAPADGVVRLAHGPFLLEGNLIMLDHGHGLVSAFLHLSRIDVKEGEHVTRGEQLGLVGMTGRATGPHLHWALSWRSARLDPGLFVPEGGN